MKQREGIVENVRNIRTKMQALNYCLLTCKNRMLGCAVDCEIRRKWKLPPHGEKYYE